MESPWARFGKYSCFCLCCRRSIHDIDVLKSGDRMGRLCWSPEQAPAASWSSVIRMQPVWNVLEGFGCSGNTPRVPSPELYCQERFRISLQLFFFQEFSVDCRTGRDPMKLSSPFSPARVGPYALEQCSADLQSRGAMVSPICKCCSFW